MPFGATCPGFPGRHITIRMCEVAEAQINLYGED